MNYCNRIQGLIIHYLIQEILVEGILDVHARGIKRVYKEIFVLVYTQRTIYSSRYHDRKDSYVNF